MFKLMKYMAIVAILLQGCASPEVKDSGKSYLKVELNKQKRYKTKIKPNFYYMSLKIEPKMVYNLMSLDNINELASLFGSNVKSIFCTVTPIINGNKEKTTTLFKLAYNNKKWQTEIIDSIYTNKVLLNQNTKMELQFNYYYSNKIDVSKITDTLELKSDILPKKVVNLINNNLDNLVNDKLSSDIQDKSTYKFNPIRNKVSFKEFDVKDSRNKVISKIRCKVQLFDSITSDANKVTKNFKKTPYRAGKLSPLSVMKSTDSNYMAFLETKYLVSNNLIYRNSQGLKKECHHILDILGTELHFNKFDTLHAMRELLSKGNFTKDEKLYTSGCLKESQFSILKKMGIPLNPPIDDLNINKTDLKYLIQVALKNDTHRDSVEKLFENSIILSNGNSKIDMNISQFITYIKNKNYKHGGDYKYGSNSIKGLAFKDSLNNIYRISFIQLQPHQKIAKVIISNLSRDDIYYGGEKLKQLDKHKS